MKTALIDVAALTLALLAWAAIATVTPPYLVPSPGDVFIYLVRNCTGLLLDFAYTLAESLLGLLVAFTACAATRLLWVWIPGAATVSIRWAVALKSIPVIAVAPLLTVWFGNAVFTKAMLAAMISFFPILIGFNEGRRNIPRALSDLAELSGATAWRRFRRVELPSTVPGLTASLTIAAPLASVGALVAEFSGADVGLGHLILISAYRNDVVAMVAAILVAALLGALLYGVASRIDVAARRRLKYE
jgi:NitT/TauT family transport system permease protein